MLNKSFFSDLISGNFFNRACLVNALCYHVFGLKLFSFNVKLLSNELLIGCFQHVLLSNEDENEALDNTVKF